MQSLCLDIKYLPSAGKFIEAAQKARRVSVLGFKTRQTVHKSHMVGYSAFQGQPAKYMEDVFLKLLTISQCLIYSNSMSSAFHPKHGMQYTGIKQNTEHTLERLWSSKLTYDMEIPFTEAFEKLVQSIQTCGGKFLHNIPSKSILISIISDNVGCLQIDRSQPEHQHTIFIESRNK